VSAPEAEGERVARLLYEAESAEMIRSGDLFEDIPIAPWVEFAGQRFHRAMANAVLAYIRERDVLAVEAMEARIEAAEARAATAERALAEMRPKYEQTLTDWSMQGGELMMERYARIQAEARAEAAEARAVAAEQALRDTRGRT
jgi:hypothetical protein